MPKETKIKNAINKISSLAVRVTSFWKKTFPGRVAAKLASDKIAIYSAQSAFFMFISIFPLIIILTAIMKYTVISENDVEVFIKRMAPDVISNMLNMWISEIYNSNFGYLSISIIIVIWTASKSFIGIIDSLDYINKTPKVYPRFVNRIRALFFTLILMVVLFTAGIFIVFGNRIADLISSFFPSLEKIALQIIDSRLIIAVCLFFFIFLIIYAFVPRGSLLKNPFKRIRASIPGAVFSTGGWLLFSALYSLYIDRFAMNSVVYGSITTFVILMLWLYFCMYIFLISAEINKYLSDQNANNPK